MTRTTVQLDSEMLDWLLWAAKQRKMSRSALVRSLCEDYRRGKLYREDSLCGPVRMEPPRLAEAVEGATGGV